MCHIFKMYIAYPINVIRICLIYNLFINFVKKVETDQIFIIYNVAIAPVS
jgi:hypothetical protein